MKRGLSVGLFYNCQPLGIGLLFNSERECAGRVYALIPKC